MKNLKENDKESTQIFFILFQFYLNVYLINQTTLLGFSTIILNYSITRNTCN